MKDAVFEELLAGNVVWYCKERPHLAWVEDWGAECDEVRYKETLEASKMSLRLLMFQVYFSRSVVGAAHGDGKKQDVEMGKSGKLGQSGESSETAQPGPSKGTTHARDEEDGFTTVSQKKRENLPSATTTSTTPTTIPALQSMAEHMNLAKIVVDSTKQIYKLVDEDKTFKGKSPEAIAAACINIACRQDAATKTFKEVCGANKIPKKETGGIYGKLLNGSTFEISLMPYVMGNDFVILSTKQLKGCIPLDLTVPVSMYIIPTLIGGVDSLFDVFESSLKDLPLVTGFISEVQNWVYGVAWRGGAKVQHHIMVQLANVKEVQLVRSSAPITTRNSTSEELTLAFFEITGSPAMVRRVLNQYGDVRVWALESVEDLELHKRFARLRGVKRKRVQTPVEEKEDKKEPTSKHNSTTYSTGLLEWARNVALKFWLVKKLRREKEDVGEGGEGEVEWSEDIERITEKAIQEQNVAEMEKVDAAWATARAMREWRAVNRKRKDLEQEREELKMMRKEVEKTRAALPRCPICYEAKPTAVTDCGHPFCKPCIAAHHAAQSANNGTPTGPTCRKTYTYHALYL
ncbi:Transcription initiation factor IIB [Rhizophlyctis rosea]|nr:Transcription initiation factor IIB [Rhizophlyctis rosea]